MPSAESQSTTTVRQSVPCWGVAVIGAVDWSEVEANEELLCKHMHLEDEVRVQAAKLAPMHVVD